MASMNIPIQSSTDSSIDDIEFRVVEPDSHDSIDYTNPYIHIPNTTFLHAAYRDRPPDYDSDSFSTGHSSPGSSPQMMFSDPSLTRNLSSLDITSLSSSFGQQSPLRASPTPSNNSTWSSSYGHSSDSGLISPLLFPYIDDMHSQMSDPFPCATYYFDPMYRHPESSSEGLSTDLLSHSLVDKHPPPSPSVASDCSKLNLDESLNEIMTEIQDDDPSVVQGKLMREVSFKAGEGAKVLFGKTPKVNVGSEASKTASILRRTKPGKFFCTFQGCESSFTRKAGLKSHYKSHLGVTDLECPFCGARTATSLDRHKKRCKQNPNREPTAPSARKPRKKGVASGSSKS